MRFLKIIGSLLCAGAMATGVAQCTLVLQSVETSCASHDPFVRLTLNGGTLPYQVSFSTQDGYFHSIQIAQNGPVQTTLFGAASHAPPMEMMVTDAQGCTASDAGWYTLHQAIFPEAFVTYPCSGGAQLRWNGRFSTATGTYGPSPCEGALSYSIMGPTLHSGLITEDWVQDAPGLWRFNDVLSPGFYQLTIGTSGGECSNGGLVICYANTFVEVLADPVECGSVFTLRAALAGVTVGPSLMSDQLRAQSLIPYTEPYSALGYTYVEFLPGTSFPANVFSATGANAVVDWVVLELRNASNPAQVAFSRPALLQRDGDVVTAADGFNHIRTPLSPGLYHVSLRHRNHLGVMTAAPVIIDLDNYTAAVDLRSLSTATYGTNAGVNVNGVLAMPCGDSDGSGTVSYTGSGNDRDIVLVAIGGVVPTNALTNVYDRRDVNLDGNVMYTGLSNDRDVILQSIGGTIPTAVRTQQLP